MVTRLLSSRWIAVWLCALGLLMTNLPVIADGFRSVQGDLIDGRIVHYFLEHGYRWILHPLDVSLWDAPFFHPMPNALAYSDAMIALVPLYAPLRLLGLAPDTSFQWWVMIVMAATFVAAYTFARVPLALARFPSAMAAFLVAFGAPRAAQMGHPQLLAQFLPLLAILMAAVAVRDIAGAGERTRWRTNALLAGAFVCLALQFYAAVYLAWLTALGLMIVTVAALVWRRERTTLMVVVRRGLAGLLVGLVVSAVLLLPFVAHYRAAAADLGPRSWQEVACFLPSPATWLAPAPESWLYGRLSGLVIPADDPCRPEKYLSFGYVTLIACLAGLIVARRRAEARIVTASLVGLVVCSTVVGGATLWWLVYHGIPGAIAIRAVGRIVLVVLVPASLGLAYLLTHLEQRGRRGWAVAIGVVCILEQGVTTKHYERDEARNRIAHAAAAIPDACRAFHLTTELHPVYTAITAMWAGLERDAAAVNGHSGSWPPGYPFEKPPAAERQAVVTRWVEARGGDMSRVCLVEASVRARLVSADVPRAMVAGQRYDVTVVVENLGPRTWERAHLVRLGVVGTTDWGLGRVELPHDVPPGERVTFSFQVVAPVASGAVPFVWGIVEEGVEWKTEDLGIGTVAILRAGAPANTGADAAVLVSADVPRRMVAGRRYRVTLVVRNAGAQPWRREHLVRLGSQEPENNLEWGPGRIELPRDVEPGDTVAIAFDVTAPQGTGAHAFSWSVVREGVAWIGPVLRAGPVIVVPDD